MRWFLSILQNLKGVFMGSKSLDNCVEFIEGYLSDEITKEELKIISAMHLFDSSCEEIAKIIGRSRKLHVLKKLLYKAIKNENEVCDLLKSDYVKKNIDTSTSALVMFGELGKILSNKKKPDSGIRIK